MGRQKAPGRVTFPVERGRQQEEPMSEQEKKGGSGPFIVVGAALAAGIVLAKFIDWRGHAHPRR